MERQEVVGHEEFAPKESFRSGDMIRIPDSHAPVSDHPCPNCGPDCRSPLNRKRKTLRVWNDGNGFISWRCARCDATGWKRVNSLPNVVRNLPVSSGLSPSL